MESNVETQELIVEQSEVEESQLSSFEELCDLVDNKFINFYGEYGRKIVNERRSDFNKDGMVNLKML